MHRWIERQSLSAGLARAVGGVAGATVKVTELAGKTGVAATEFLLAADALNHDAAELRQEVDRFLGEGRSAWCGGG